MNASSIRNWIDTHQTQVMVAGAGGVAGIALYVRHKNASSSATTAATTAAADTAGLSGTPDTSATDEQNDLQDELNSQFSALQSQLEGQIQALQPTTTTATPPASAPPVVMRRQPPWAGGTLPTSGVMQRPTQPLRFGSTPASPVQRAPKAGGAP